MGTYNKHYTYTEMSTLTTACKNAAFRGLLPFSQVPLSHTRNSHVEVASYWFAPWNFLVLLPHVLFQFALRKYFQYGFVVKVEYRLELDDLSLKIGFSTYLAV